MIHPESMNSRRLSPLPGRKETLRTKPGAMQTGIRHDYIQCDEQRDSLQRKYPSRAIKSSVYASASVIEDNLCLMNGRAA
jgi:hypothetical protein